MSPEQICPCSDSAATEALSPAALPPACCAERDCGNTTVYYHDGRIAERRADGSEYLIKVPPVPLKEERPFEEEEQI